MEGQESRVTANNDNMRREQTAGDHRNVVETMGQTEVDRKTIEAGIETEATRTMDAIEGSRDEPTEAIEDVLCVVNGTTWQGNAHIRRMATKRT